MRVVTVANQKGGVTKTTTSVAIAGFLAQDGHKVLLIDVDPQGNATLGCGKGLGDYEYSAFDLFHGNEMNSEKLIINAWANLDILPCNITLCALELSATINNTKIFLDILSKFLGKIEGKYDYVVIDTPPSLGTFTINAVLASNRFIVPINGGDPFALIGFINLYNNLRKIWSENNHKLRPIGFFRTAWRSNNLSQSIWTTLSTSYQSLAMQTIIPVNVTISEAMAQGVHISEYDKKATSNLAYRALTDEIKERWEGAVWL